MFANKKIANKRFLEENKTDSCLLRSSYENFSVLLSKYNYPRLSIIESSTHPLKRFATQPLRTSWSVCLYQNLQPHRVTSKQNTDDQPLFTVLKDASLHEVACWVTILQYSFVITLLVRVIRRTLEFSSRYRNKLRAQQSFIYDSTNEIAKITCHDGQRFHRA